MPVATVLAGEARRHHGEHGAFTHGGEQPADAEATVRPDPFPPSRRRSPPERIRVGACDRRRGPVVIGLRGDDRRVADATDGQ
jgi:hypothetical protein